MNKTTGVSSLSARAQERADGLGDEGDWVFARRKGRGWELATYRPTGMWEADDKVRQSYFDSGWRQVDYGR